MPVHLRQPIVKLRFKMMSEKLFLACVLQGQRKTHGQFHQFKEVALCARLSGFEASIAHSTEGDRSFCFPGRAHMMQVEMFRDSFVSKTMRLHLERSLWAVKIRNCRKHQSPAGGLMHCYTATVQPCFYGTF